MSSRHRGRHGLAFAFADIIDLQSGRRTAAGPGVDQKTISNWLEDSRNCAEFLKPAGYDDKNPWGNAQHFDVWDFAKADKDAGQQSYFGVAPPQGKPPPGTKARIMGKPRRADGSSHYCYSGERGNYKYAAI
jgi:hypothetical protein